MRKKWMIAAALSALCLLPTAPAAAATDPWAAAAQALGIYGAYKSTLTDILRVGNNVHAQMSSRRQDLQKNGRNRNVQDDLLVNRIMEQLITKGDYAMRVNSLPFIWAVNDSSSFNASCYPTNYISVNRALVRGLDSDEDALAAVLAHEMVHGLKQHSAYSYAQAVAQSMGITMVGVETGRVDWQKLNGLVGYSIATNIMMPTEMEADEEGFRIMTSAGFNPGGPAAAMARMRRYLRYETTDMYEFDSQDKKRNDEYSDHPETAEREKKLLEMVTEYSAGHVTVENKRDVLIDGELLLSAPDTGEERDNTWENAYYIAGGLAKAFHDYEDVSGWQFRRAGNGTMDFLGSGRVYRCLKRMVASDDMIRRLEAMVVAAYQKEQRSDVRKKLREAAELRKKELDNIRQEALNADRKLAERLRYNSDAYSDYGYSGLAMVEMERAMASKHQDNLAECYVIRGRAKAVDGDFAAALQDADRGISMDDKNPINYLNRADIYRMLGDMEKALADCTKAREMDAKSAVAWLLTAEVYDDMNRREEAMEAYRRLHELSSETAIPRRYLKEIDPKAAEKMEREEAKKQKELQEQKNRKEAEGKGK